MLGAARVGQRLVNSAYAIPIPRRISTWGNMSQKPFVIGDPVHRYLGVRAHERFVVDHSVTQRLRNISQTGFAQYVFPEARTTRFSHSLGAMHLASRFLCACIENASGDVQAAFLHGVHDVFNAQALKVSNGAGIPATLEDMDALREGGGIAGGGSSATRLIWSSTAHDSDTQRRLAVFAEGGLRLAALFHDVGHLPFSHDFETALHGYANAADTPSDGLKWVVTNADMPPHEVIGHELARAAMGPLVNSYSSAEKEPRCERALRALLMLATEILHASSPPTIHNPRANAVQWLHSLIDGDIDVDRADYLKRDGRNLGADFGQFDLDRIATNLVLAKTDDLGFVTAVDEKAAAAVEAYFLARSRSAQLMIHHHKVAQVGLAFQFASTKALSAGYGQQLLELVDRLRGATSADVLADYARFDDVWWLCQLRQYEERGATSALEKAALKVVLRREPALQAVWKRGTDMPDVERRRWNALFGEGYFDQTIRREFESRNLLVLPHKFKAFTRRRVSDKASDGTAAAVLVRSNSTLVPLDRFSPSVATLEAWYDADAHFHIYGLRERPAGTDLRSVAGEALAWWEGLLGKR